LQAKATEDSAKLSRQIQTITQEKEKLQTILRAKDQEVWDAQREIENKVQVIASLEEAKKKKKNVECVQCLQKDAEIKGLGAKVDKVSPSFLYRHHIADTRHAEDPGGAGALGQGEGPADQGSISPNHSALSVNLICTGRKVQSSLGSCP
jgi:chromosome segregation ATPase